MLSFSLESGCWCLGAGGGVQFYRVKVRALRVLLGYLFGEREVNPVVGR